MSNTRNQIKDKSYKVQINHPHKELRNNVIINNYIQEVIPKPPFLWNKP
jgi:hypothetical protein